MVSDFDFRNLFDTNTGYFRVFYMFFIYPSLFSKTLMFIFFAKNTDVLCSAFFFLSKMFFVQLIHKAGIFVSKEGPTKEDHDSIPRTKT
jgi:hypothetical protein